MADILLKVDTAVVVPANKMPLVSSTDFITPQAVAFNAAGMDLRWNFLPADGSTVVSTAVTPTTAGVHDWTDNGDGMMMIEIPLSGGDVRNDTEGFGWFSGKATGVAPWCGPTIQFSPAVVVDALLNGTGLGIRSDVRAWLGTAAATPTVAGLPEVDATHFNGVAGTFTSGRPEVRVFSINADAINSTAIANSSMHSAAFPAATLNAFADALLDRDVTTHRTANSVGSVLQPLRVGTCQNGGDTTHVILDASADGNTDAYKYCIIQGWVTADGTNRFSAICSAYDGGTKSATINSIPYSPNNTYTFVVKPFGAVPGASAPTADENAIALLNKNFSTFTTEGTLGAYFNTFHLHAGTATAATGNTITLDASGGSSHATTNIYQYQAITVRMATGLMQTRQIISYDGPTKVATVNLNWTVPPTNGEYVIHPNGLDAATVATIAAGVWNADRTTFNVAGTMGEYVRADTKRLGGFAAPLDNLVLAFDGTGYGFAGCTMPTTTVAGSVTGNVGGDLAGSVLGSVASVSGAVASVTGAVGSVTGNVGGNVVGSVASVSGAVASVTGAVGSVTGNVGGNVVGSVASVTVVSDKTGYRLSAQGVDDLLDEVVEGSTTLRQAVRGYNAALLAKASGLGTTTATFRDIGDTKDRIVATVDASGNRSAITLDLT